MASLLPFLARALRSHPHGPDEESVLGYVESVQDERPAARRTPPLRK